MASNDSSKKKIGRRKKQAGSRKLTLAEIEARLDHRTKAAQAKIRRLEQSQIVTEATMRLEFKPVVSHTYIVQTDKSP